MSDPVDPLTPTQAATESGEPATLGTAPVERVSVRDIPTYELGEVIGRGGMGEVIAARDRTFGREVALKRMRADSPSPEHVERFLREARIQARLDHPAIAPVHELGYDSDGLPYFTMKRVGGATLAALLEAKTEKPQRLLRALVDVCHAAELAHSRRIVHRDLKPSNIMLGDYGEVYVLDWGVARVMTGDRAQTSPSTDDVPSLDGVTKAGALLGTPGYMAPEQVRGEAVGPAADVYSLGSMLFEILAGEPLHPRNDAIASTMTNVSRSPSQRNPARAVAPELDTICAAALATDPNLRPSAGAIATAIQDYLDGDRDVERRRELAGKLASSARAALEKGDSAHAMRSAGRALAFDPTSSEATAIVTQLVLAGPSTTETPDEVDAALEKEEQRLMRQRSKRAVLPYGAIFSTLPLVPFLHVQSYPMLAAVYVAFALMVGITWLNSRVGVPILLTLTGHAITALLFSRLAGPFIITPIMLCAILLSATSIPWLNRRPLAILVWTCGTVMLPFVLEWAGVLAPSWAMTSDGILSTGNVFVQSQMPASLGIAGNVAAICLVAFYARGIGRDRREAQRRLFLQAWHLRHLLPKPAE
ncbi:MAG TPA: serine/threonine-protein kinase [Kofleriaceae bacterium]|nr:serine/threonine-protein kinase [Kofleriaceae bacterium]